MLGVGSLSWGLTGGEIRLGTLPRAIATLCVAEGTLHAWAGDR